MQQRSYRQTRPRDGWDIKIQELRVQLYINRTNGTIYHAKKLATRRRKTRLLRSNAAIQHHHTSTSAMEGDRPFWARQHLVGLDISFSVGGGGQPMGVKAHGVLRSVFI